MAPVVHEGVLCEVGDVMRRLAISRREVDALERSGELEPVIVLPSGRRIFASSDVTRVVRARATKRRERGR